MLLMPQMTEIYQMYAAFIMIGYNIGTVMVSFPVYTLRLYTRSNRALFRLLAIYGISKTLSPLPIQIVIDKYDSYAPFMYLVSASFSLLCIAFICLKTPKH